MSRVCIFQFKANTTKAFSWVNHNVLSRSSICEVWLEIRVRFLHTSVHLSAYQQISMKVCVRVSCLTWCFLTFCVISVHAQFWTIHRTFETHILIATYNNVTCKLLFLFIFLCSMRIVFFLKYSMCRTHFQISNLQTLTEHYRRCWKAHLIWKTQNAFKSSRSLRTIKNSNSNLCPY